MGRVVGPAGRYHTEVKTSEALYFISRQEWRNWLEKNHDKEKEIWMIYYKKHTGKPSISYEDALDEALCFGWIDSIVRRIDEERYSQKFTPRVNTSKWSDLNIGKIRKLIVEGRMTEAGLAKIDDSILNDDSPSPVRKIESEIPEEVIRIIAANEKALENFNKLAPSHKREYIKWVMSAKKEETRRKRLNEVIDVLARNRKLGMK